jgi:hypothetical protein
VGTEPVLPTATSCCVEGKEGGLERCGTVSTPSGTSIRPLFTKTLALGLATMTRGCGRATRPDSDFNSVATGSGVTGWGAGGTRGARAGAGAGALLMLSGATSWDGGFCGKRGVVLALAGEPLMGGADGFCGGGGGVELGATFEMLGMGLVTAVDQAGGTFVTGAGSIWLDVLIGSVVAAEMLGRGVGMIFPDAGLSGRGGRLMRSVSRFGAFESDPSGVGESAIFILFIVISENVQW